MSLGISSRKITSIVFLLATIVISLVLSGIPILVSHAVALPPHLQEGMGNVQNDAISEDDEDVDDVDAIVDVNGTDTPNTSCRPLPPSAQAILAEQNARRLQYLFDEQYKIAVKT